jgi:hypothetical protein
MDEIWLRHPSMKKLLRALRRERRVKLLTASILLLISMALSFTFFSVNPLLAALGLVGVVLGLRYVYQFAGYQSPEDEELIALMRRNPRHIVWVYAIVTEHLPYGFRFSYQGVLYFKLADGDEMTVSLPAKHIPSVSRFLNRILPHATFGYSEYRKAQYQTNPRLLIRSNSKE